MQKSKRVVFGIIVLAAYLFLSWLFLFVPPGLFVLAFPILIVPYFYLFLIGFLLILRKFFFPRIRVKAIFIGIFALFVLNALAGILLYVTHLNDPEYLIMSEIPKYPIATSWTVHSQSRDPWAGRYPERWACLETEDSARSVLTYYQNELSKKGWRVSDTLDVGWLVFEGERFGRKRTGTVKSKGSFCEVGFEVRVSPTLKYEDSGALLCKEKLYAFFPGAIPVYEESRLWGAPSATPFRTVLDEEKRFVDIPDDLAWVTCVSNSEFIEVDKFFSEMLIPRGFQDITLSNSPVKHLSGEISDRQITIAYQEAPQNFPWSTVISYRKRFPGGGVDYVRPIDIVGELYSPSNL